MGIDREREFFRLAGFVLGCKMRANGGTVEGDSDPRCATIRDGKDKLGCLLGEVDYSAEMGMILQEARRVSAISR